MLDDRALIAALAIAVAAPAAHAEEVRDLATANALFDEAKQLSSAGAFDEACRKFEASMSLAPRLGVQLNLADCYEHVGRLASAWLVFGEAAAIARRAADPREQFARARQDALVPRLSRIAIVRSGAAIDDVVVTRDGARVPPSVWGVGVPVDPGVHVVAASAPGRVVWSTTVVVPGEGTLISAVVPDLDRAVPAIRPASAALAAPRAIPPEPMQRPIPPGTWIAAGVGVVGLGVGTAFGLAARSQSHDAQRDCDAAQHCTDAADAMLERSRLSGNLATAGFAIAGAAIVTGVVLYLRAPRVPRRPTVAPVLGPHAVGMVARWPL